MLGRPRLDSTGSSQSRKLPKPKTSQLLPQGAAEAPVVSKAARSGRAPRPRLPGISTAPGQEGGRNGVPRGGSRPNREVGHASKGAFRTPPLAHRVRPLPTRGSGPEQQTPASRCWLHSGSLARPVTKSARGLPPAEPQRQAAQSKEGDIGITQQTSLACSGRAASAAGLTPNHRGTRTAGGPGLQIAAAACCRLRHVAPTPAGIKRTFHHQARSPCKHGQPPASQPAQGRRG